VTVAWAALRTYWRYTFSWKRAGTSLLAAFGALWLAVQVASFFSVSLAGYLQTQWVPFLLLGILWAIAANWPKHRVSFRLAGRDIRIAIQVGDIFALQGAIVVGTNTTFDTEISSGIISERSIQGAYTRKYYDTVAHLDRDLEEQLMLVPSTFAPPEKRGKLSVYPLGTCVKLASRGRDSYWVAIASMNLHGNASGSMEDLRRGLPLLWDFVATQGDCGTLLLPVLGSGYSRMTETREEIIRELVQSFIAACSSKRFCETLTIVVSPRDFYTCEINLADLGDYVRHVCRYTQLKSPADSGLGTAIS
jgi:hypothetical protein